MQRRGRYLRAVGTLRALGEVGEQRPHSMAWTLLLSLSLLSCPQGIQAALIRIRVALRVNWAMVSSSGAQTPARPGSAEDCGGLWRPPALPQVGEALESAPWTSRSALLTFPSFGPLSNPICPRQVNQSPQGPVTSSNYPLGHVLPNTWPTYRSHPAKPELVYSHTPSNRTDSPC